MKLKTKIVIDHLIGKPTVFLLKLMARTLGFFLRIDHTLNGPFERIVITKFLGLGSIIQSTPLIQSLKKSFPNAKIIFVTTQSNLAIFKHIEDVDQVLCISDKNIWQLVSSSLKLLFHFWQKKPSVYIDLEIYSNYSSIITTLSIAKDRLGYFQKGKSYRRGIYTHLQNYDINIAISQSYLQFAHLLQAEHITENLKLTCEDMDLFSKGITAGMSYIIINPNASDLRLERRWDKSNFISLINQIHNLYPQKKLVLIGSKGETSYVADIEKSIVNKNNLINTAGKLHLSELLSLIKHATLMITNDTGPMHMAFALKTKTISLFGPCSPKQYGQAENNISIYKKAHCSPCVHEHITPPCKGNNICMKQIEVGEVLNTIL